MDNKVDGVGSTSRPVGQSNHAQRSVESKRTEGQGAAQSDQVSLTE